MTAGPKAIHLLVDGPRGTDGADGSRGGDAHFPGNDGADAGDAGPATRGMRGGQVDLFLSSSASSSDVSPASVHVCAKTVNALGAARSVDEQVPFPDFRSVVTSARGGDGGHGGNGGRGGAGARGKKGTDATRYSNGGDGGRGGDGGDGGIGTSGAAAGDGGTIRVFVDDADTYLLMAVEGADAPDARVAGGKGGQAGLHGEGGQGGGGGPGGDSYSWTETHSRTESYTDSNGSHRTRSVSYTTHHRNPGGSRGWPGSDGRTPATPRFHGRDGAHGSFEIHVTSDGERRVYPRRYDLALSSFSFVEPDAPDDDGIYEPGERIAITDLCFENTGRMPTPSRQRVRVTLLPGTHVLPLPEEAFLPTNIDVDSAVTVHDRLAFRIRDVDITKAGEPYIVTEQVRPRAEQLGQEHGDTSGRDAPFARTYENVTYSRLLAVRFPVENRGGIRALRSLAPGEQTRIDFETRNISAKDLGRSSTRGRPLALRLEHVGGDVPAGSVLFHDESGSVHDFALGGASAGYFFELPFLESRGSHIVSGHVGFTKDVRLYAHARLRYTILLDDLGPDEKLRVVQAREIELRVEPGYRWEPDTRVLLVTNNNTTREAYEAWHRLLEDDLGLAVDDWSLTRYGHFDHKEPLPDGTDLYTHLEDKVVVLLNHPFHPRSDDVTERPADYLRGRDFRRGATSNNTHTLLVGGDFDFQQLLEPTDDVRVGGDDFDSVRQFLKRERKAAGPLVQETFKEDITNVYDVVGVEKLTFPFLTPKPYALRQKALKLQKRLVRLHPNRRYVLVHKDKAPVRAGHFLGLIPRWDIGDIEVRRTLNDESSSGVVVRAEGVNDSGYILSPEARFAVALSLPFEGKLDRLSWLLLRPGDAFDADQRAMADALVAAMLVDLAEEQTALRRRRDDVSEEVMREKLSCLGRLLSHPLPTELAVGSNRWQCLFSLVGGLQALVKSHSPWWRVVGRGARINRFTTDCVERLMASAFNGYALDPHGDVAMESDTARARIDAVSTSWMARVTGLHGHWRVQGRRASLGDAALHLLQHPEVGAAISRDIDAWQAAEERVWSGHDFERAQLAERGRVEAQDALKRQNAEEREALLRVPAAPVLDEEAVVEVEEEVQAISRA